MEALKNPHRICVFFVGFWIQLLLVCFSCSVTASTHHEDSVFRHGYGVYFKSRSRFEVVTDTYYHVFDFKLPTFDIDEESPSLACMSHENRSNTHSCQSATPYYDALRKLRKAAHSQIKQSIRQIHSILRTPRSDASSQKFKRGWFDVIGTVGYHLFGLARKSDIEVLEERIKILSQRDARILKDFEQQLTGLASASSILNKRVDFINEQLSHQEKWMADLSQQLRTTWANSLHFSTFLAGSLLNFTRIFDHITHLRLAAEELLAGRLHPALLHRSHIQHALDRIVVDLRSRHEPARILLRDVSFFYKRPYFVAAKSHTLLYVTISIPISTLLVSFKFYEVITYPKSIADTHQSSTQLVNVPKFFAISTDHRLFAIWDTAPNLELGDYSYLMDISNINLNSELNTCIVALFKDDAIAVSDLCSFKLLSDRPSILIPFPPDSVIIENIFNLSLICRESELQLFKGCLSCVAKIPSGCAINSPYGYIPSQTPQNQNSSSATSQVSLAYGANKIILQYLFHPDQWKAFGSDQLLNQSIFLHLPPFQISKSDSASFAALDEEFQTTMQAIQQGAVLFENDYSALVSESHQPFVDNSFKYVMISGLSVSFSGLMILVIVIIYLCVRINKLTVLIMTLSARTHSVESYPQYIFPLTSTLPPFDCTYPSTLHFYLLIVILVLIILFLISYLILRCFRTRKAVINGSNNYLVLRFANSEQYVDIRWFNLPYPLSECQLSAKTNITNVQLQRSYCVMLLTFEWNLDLFHIPSNLHILPSAQIHIDWFDVIKLRAIVGVNKTFSVTMWLYEMGRSQFLQIQPHMSSDDDERESSKSSITAVRQSLKDFKN